MLVLLPTLFILLRLLARPGKVPHMEVTTESFTFSPKRILTLAIFFLSISGWLFSGQLSSYFGITKSFDTIVALSALLILAALRLVRWRDIDRTTDWGVLF